MGATVVMFFIVLTVIVVFVTRPSNTKKELPPDEGELKVKLGEGGPTPAKSSHTSVAEYHRSMDRNQRSLDMTYALSHGMWVCERCETLNDNGLGSCKVCGAGK